MGDRKRRLLDGMILIAFGIAFYSILQNPTSLTGYISKLLAILDPLLIGLGLAFFLNVFMSAIEKLLKQISFLRNHARARRYIALPITIIVTALLVYVVIRIILPRVVEAISTLLVALPAASARLSDWAGKVMTDLGTEPETIEAVQNEIRNFVSQIATFLRSSSGTIANTVVTTVVTTLSTLINIIFSVIMAIYVLLTKERIGEFCKKVIRHFIPSARAEGIIRIAGISHATFTSFIGGQLIECCILGTLCALGMTIFGFPYVAMISLIVGILQMLPIFGAWTSAVFGALFIATQSPEQALWFLVFIICLQQFECNIIYPRVVGGKVGLPGVLVLTAVVIGKGLLGALGLLIAVPCMAVLYNLLREHMRVKAEAGTAEAPAEEGAAAPEAAVPKKPVKVPMPNVIRSRISKKKKAK